MFGTLSLSPGVFRWWIVLLAYVGSIAVLIGISSIGLGAEFGQMAIFLGYVLLAIIIAQVFARARAAQELGVARPVDRRRIVVVSLAAAAVTVLLAELGGLVDADISRSTKTVLADIGFGTSDRIDALIILMICCLAPLGEEALYRGLIFRGIFNPLRALRHPLLGPWPASVIAATLAAYIFALSHGGEGQETSVVAIIFLSGIVFGLCYAITGSLWTAVMAHSFNNTIAIALPALPSESVSLLNKALILAAPVVTWCLLSLWARLYGAQRQ